MRTLTGLTLLARGGYAARGLVYLIIGVLALLAARGSGQPADSHDSLEALLAQPFGHFLVGLVVVGLVAFAAWRILPTAATGLSCPMAASSGGRGRARTAGSTGTSSSSPSSSWRAPSVVAPKGICGNADRSEGPWGSVWGDCSGMPPR